jgi:hypothetical protein
MPINERCAPKRILERLPASEIEAEGWERRFIADPERVDEAVELYAQLGFEVHAEPVLASELGGDCNDCALVATCHFKTIYTRRTPAETRQNQNNSI